MIWLFLLPVFSFASDQIITFENLKLKLVGQPAACPEVSSLQRSSDMYWSAPGGWKSYNLSFSKTVNNLVGVQWQGDKVGNIFCLYKDYSKLTFPISLQAPGIYLRPAKWHAEKDGNMTCKFDDLNTCLFQKVEEVVKTYKNEENLLKFLEGIKHGESDVE